MEGQPQGNLPRGWIPPECGGGETRVGGGPPQQASLRTWKCSVWTERPGDVGKMALTNYKAFWVMQVIEATRIVKLTIAQT